MILLKMNEYLQQGKTVLMEFLPSLIGAIITLVIGFWVINRLVRVIEKAMDKRNVDESLKPFLQSIAKTILVVLLIISVASMVGIRTTSFIAIIGAAGLAVGLALQGSLANFAGGVLLLMLKPFRVGDYINTQGVSGTVNEIQIFYTVLYTPQNQKIVVPNGGVANNFVINYSDQDTRRLDFAIGIAYSSDIDKAKVVLRSVFDNDERILKEPETEYLVEGLSDSSVDLKVRAWTNTDEFWPLYFDVHEEVKKAFDREGINIPFPQRDVHLYQHANE